MISQKVLPMIWLNPASLYCKQIGGISEIQEWTGGQINICRFPSGSSCEEWAFFRWECPTLPQQWTVDNFRLNILSLLPSNLVIEVEKLFSSFDTSTGDFQQDQRKAILQEIIYLIRKNTAPVGQEINNNQIDSIDMEGIIMPNICNIMNFYNIVSEECPTTWTDLTGTELTGTVETWWLMDQANQEVTNQQPSTEITETSSQTSTVSQNTNTMEFSINDSKYEISSVWSQNVINTFKTENNFDWLISNTNPKCPDELADSTTQAYKDKYAYYVKLFSVYQSSDQEKIYLVKDKTLWKKTDGIHVYVMQNKIWYTNKTDFIKDFSRYCSIRPRIPITISKNYLIFFDSCDNWAMDVVGCDEATINDLTNKIIVN